MYRQLYKENKTLIHSTVIIFIILFLVILYSFDNLKNIVKKYSTIISKKEKVIKECRVKNKNLNSLIITKNKELKEEKQKTSLKSYVNVNKSTLENDIKKYSKLSSKMKVLIIKTVLDTSKKYDLNPLLVYSLLHTESSMRFYIQHSTVHLVIKGKKVTTRAVGLGGVIWEWWGDKLKKENIAFSRSDLFLPDVNIKAVGYILNEFRKSPTMRGCKSRDESMLRRYFGGNYKFYSDKIDKKIMNLVRSELYKK